MNHENLSILDGNLDSPCFSVHNINDVRISMCMDDVTNYKETDESVCKDKDCVPSIDQENLDSDNRDLIVANDLHSSRSFETKT